jgi:hypothetical protein
MPQLLCGSVCGITLLCPQFGQIEAFMPTGTQIGSGLITGGQPFFVPGTNLTCHWPSSFLRIEYPLSRSVSLFACQMAQNPGLTGPHFAWRGAHLGFDIGSPGKPNQISGLELLQNS